MADDKATQKQGSFSERFLTEQQRTDFQYFKERKIRLQKSRQSHYGHNIDKLWAQADLDYIPHRLKTGKQSKRVIATDEDKGWRGTIVDLGSADWQSDVSQANPFVKIQTALSIMLDQNPSGVFTATKKQYQATTDLIKQLYERSWEFAKSKPQLKLFIFNLAKYGWACARTFPLRVTRKVKVLVEYNPENPEDSKYEEKEVVEFNDIMRENLDPRNVWIDDMARPNNPLSLRDWCWRKVYDFDTAKEEFGKYKMFEYVQPGGNVQETVGVTAKDTSKQTDAQNQVEIYFYENRAKDLFIAEANGVPFIMEPLPVADAKGLKKLSLWQTYWNIRHAESPYGVGIWESIRYDQGMLDRIRNMTIDQLTLSIYKMFFYQGTQSLTDTGDIRITPGAGKQVLDPKAINWLEVPGPGNEAWMGIDMFRKDLDEASGITDPLIGVVTGKTAFEIAQAKESALKRMKNPLDNILEALNDEGYITVSLIQLLYSIPETYQIADKRLIEDYLKEIESDPDLFERTQTGVDELGEPIESFTAKVYPEFPLNLEKDEQGNLTETSDTRFFRVKPGSLTWEGVINIKSQSLLSPSKQVDKALEIEMYNVLTPMLQDMREERLINAQTGQPTDVDNLTLGKSAKEIIKLYDKDPRDVLPEMWMSEEKNEQSLFVPAQQAAGIPPGVDLTSPAPAGNSAASVATNPQSLVSKISNKASQPFRV